MGTAVPSATLAPEGTLSAPPRPIPWRTCLLVVLGGQWIPALWLGVALPWFGDDFADSGLLAEVRESVDVPARVVNSHWVHEYHGRKSATWDGYRVTAQFEHGGATWLAIGDMKKVPEDGKVFARVPLSRPDLAVAFVGDGPHHNPKWIRTAILSAFGVGFIVWMALAHLRHLGRLRRGRLVRVRHVSQRTYKSRHLLRVRYLTARGDVETELNLDKAEAARVLAESAPVVVFLDERPHEVFALASFAGLRVDEANGNIAPAPWRALLLAFVPVLIMVVATYLGLKWSYQLPP